MTIDPAELELKTTFYKERLVLQDKHQNEVKALQDDQNARYAAFRKAKDPKPAPAPVPAPTPAPAPVKPPTKPPLPGPHKG